MTESGATMLVLLLMIGYIYMTIKLVLSARQERKEDEDVKNGRN